MIDVPDYCDQDVFTVCTTCYSIGLLVKDHGYNTGDKRSTYDCSCSDYSFYKVINKEVAELVAHMTEDIKELIGE